MSRSLQWLTPRMLLCIGVLLGAGLAFGATIRSEDGTPEQQYRVRISRDISELPIKALCSVNPEKELFITHLSVVEDCYRTTWTGNCQAPSLPATRGAWTFGRLVEGIFGSTDPVVLSDQVKAWIDQAATARVVNEDSLKAREQFMNLLANWPRIPGTDHDHLDMQQAPMRLLAIVARLDLRQNAAYSGGATAGEGRFVFGVLGKNQSLEPFVIILEYGLDAIDCADIQEWAQAWHALGALPFGPEYNAALQQVTDRFAAIGASPSKPNGSALNQVRTNEIGKEFPLEIGDRELWELREFRLANEAGVAPLVHVTVAQTPQDEHQRQRIVAQYVNGRASAIVNNNYVVPLRFETQAFRGGASKNPLNLNWDGPPPACTSILNHDARHVFSLNTCNGCHGAETGTSFTHVDPRAPGSPSQLSGFLTGTARVDMCGRPRQFGDIERRRVDLCQLLAKSCAEVESEPVVTFVH